jgi:hypothetical protein
MLLIDFNKACDSVRQQDLHNIFTESNTTIKPVAQTKMCQYKTHRPHMGINLFDEFVNKNV